MKSRPTEFVEPFAGGAIVGLNIAFHRLAEHVTLVELDADVAAVWKTVIEGDAECLANRIMTFELTPESVDAVLADDGGSLRDLAFRTILRNRISHGGILAPGSGRLKNGENGRGIRSRWYPKTLRKRILAIARMRDRITFMHGDGLRMMKQFGDRADAVFFIDPPYTAAGKKPGRRLYAHSDLDHEHLFEITRGLAGDFLMTYNDAQDIRELARHSGFDVLPVEMKNTRHEWMTELLIGRSLDWAR